MVRGKLLKERAVSRGQGCKRHFIFLPLNSEQNGTSQLRVLSEQSYRGTDSETKLLSHLLSHLEQVTSLICTSVSSRGKWKEQNPPIYECSKMLVIITHGYENMSKTS